jgi:hypothetical protein
LSVHVFKNKQVAGASKLSAPYQPLKRLLAPERGAKVHSVWICQGAHCATGKASYHRAADDIAARNSATQRADARADTGPARSTV